MKLANALTSCTALTHLNLSFNRTCPASARTLARALPGCPLRHLNLAVDPAWVARAEHSQAATVRILSEALPACSALTALVLSGHQCGAGGALALGGALPSCAGLQYLDLAAYLPTHPRHVPEHRRAESETAITQ
jgi:hypothetical protein